MFFLQGFLGHKSKLLGPWCWALAKPHSWKLSCCFRSLLLETSQSSVRQYQRQSKDVLQNYGIWLWRSLTFGSPAAKANVPSPAPNKPKFSGTLLLPDPQAAGVVSPLQVIYVFNNDSWHPTFTELSRIKMYKNVTVANSGKNFREGPQHNMGGLRKN